MSEAKLRVLDEHEREQMRQWLATWQRVGPLLDEERAARIRALSDAEAARVALDLWQFARPGGGDDGAGLLVMAHTLQKIQAR